MTTNQAAIDIIKGAEGLYLEAYLCPAKKWTIGYGHTGPEVKKGLKITKEKAEELLKFDLVRFEAIIDRHVKVLLTENQFSALVSFCFNVGPGAKGVKDGFVMLKSGKSSTMLRKLNEGDYNGAAAELPKWNKAGGVVLNGLVSRRKKEMLLFLKP